MRVYVTEHFEKQAKKTLSAAERAQWRRFTDGITMAKGKPLGPVWLREARIGGKRVYFLVGDRVCLFVDVSGKDAQQATIDQIRKLVPFYQEELRRLTRRA